MEIIIFNKTKELYKSIDESKMLRKISVTNGVSRNFTYDGDLFDESITELKTLKNINLNVLSDSLLNFLYDKKRLGLNDEALEKCLEKWLSSFKLTEYICIYPINNVAFKGKVSYLDGFVELSKHSENIDSFVGKLQTNEKKNFFVGDNLITLKVKGYSKDDAKEISINLAHYISYIYNISIFLEYNVCADVHIGCDSEKYMWDGLVIQNEDKNNLLYFDSNKNIIIPAHVKKLCINNSVFNSLMKLLHKYSNQEQMSNVEKYVLLSLGLLGKAIEFKNRNYSFVMAMSSIESLLELENEGHIKRNISRRCARIISNEDNFNDNIYKIRSLYTLRSNISHGEVVYISERKLKEIIRIAIYVLFYFVIESPRIEHDYGNVDFHKYIDDILPKKDIL